MKLRNKGIGGSDASAVAGLNRYKSPVAVYLEKTGQFLPDDPGEPAYWGTQLEDLVAREFTKRTGLKAQRSFKMYKHPEHPYMIGNIDRFVTDEKKRKGILECKTASAYKADEWEGDRIPDEYALQLQHYMAVLDVDYGFFAVLIGGNRFEYRYVERNPGIVDSLIKIESEFWNERVLKGIPPAFDGSEASAVLLSRLYPESRPESSIELPATAGVLVNELKAAKLDVQQVESRIMELENELKAIMQDNEVALFKGDPVLTWKTSQTTRLDTNSLKKEQQAVYEKYSTTKPVRRFLVK
nr:YqaJ viral recombinase family protein [Paenibacillus elgii]